MPGNYFTQVGAAIARAKIGAHTAVGVNITFSHRSGATVTLIAKIIGDGNELVLEGGIETERRVLTTLISTSQAGFALSFMTSGSANSELAEPIVPGDPMTYNGRTYYALDPIGKDKWGTNYTVKWVQMKRLAAGKKG